MQQESADPTADDALAQWGAALEQMHETVALLRASLGNADLADVDLTAAEPSSPLPAALAPRARDVLEETRELEAELLERCRSIQEMLAAERRQTAAKPARTAHFFDDHL